MSRLNLADDEVINELSEQIDEASQETENEEYKTRLAKLIPCYKENKEQADKFQKSADEENKEIKSIFKEHELNEFTVGRIKATVTTATKDVMNEEVMIEKLKALQQEKKIPKTLLKSIIKTKEYVDTDALESALYNDKIKGPDLSGCFSQKEIVTFRLKEIKEKKSSKKQEDEE